MMDWARLLNTGRLRRREDKPLDFERNPFEVDQDRICFSQPFRRLQSKTQVHPLVDNDHVRTRLIHSIEVASVGQALGSKIGDSIIRAHGLALTRDDFGSLVKAACLGHDIGHPPFGHSGEYAIREWFRAPTETTAKFMDELSDSERADLLGYEGNAQTFRILTQIENYRWNGGLQLTYATLAAGMKYPWGSTASRSSESKFGFFQAEKEYAEEIADAVGLIEHPLGGWCRHPLAYVVEAADDICYAIVDLEDGIEMGSFTFEEYQELLVRFLDLKPHFRDEYDGLALTESQKISYLRSKAMFGLAEETVEQFLNNEEDLLAGSYEDELLDHIRSRDVIKEAKRIGKSRVYEHEKKRYAEIASFEIIGGLLKEFVEAVLDVRQNGAAASFKSWRLCGLMGDMTPKPEDDPYRLLLRVCDFVGGMTDRFAVGVYRQVKGISLGGLTPAPHKVA